MVLSIQNSGAISTMPPMATVTKVATASSVTLRSSFLWRSSMLMMLGSYSAGTALGPESGDGTVGLRIIGRAGHGRFITQPAGQRHRHVPDHDPAPAR
jgi:hypothetical protein